MARNLKPEYINKIRKLEAPNGYKFDIANYLYNPAYGNEYPAFQKVIAETETEQTIRRVYTSSTMMERASISRRRSHGKRTVKRGRL